MQDLEIEWEKADKLCNDGKRAEALVVLANILAADIEPDNAEAIRAKEHAIYRMGDIYRLQKQTGPLIDMLNTVRPIFSVLPKAKTTNIVRKLFDNIVAAGATISEQEKACGEMIEWARNEHRTFLRHRLQHRLAQVHFVKGDAIEALNVINSLLREVRRLDDKSLLVEIHLHESKVYYSIRNLSKARAALVAARTNANAIYCSPVAQAEIDLQSGILHAEDRDVKTAFSYLYEAFEGFHTLGDHAVEARRALKYMIISKILTDTPDELKAVLTSKSVREYAGDDIEALHQIAEACQKKNTHAFNKVLTQYAKELTDPILQRHLKDMYDQLLERHLLRIIEPYNRVQVEYLATTLRLPVDVVEARLSQMILDKKLSGIVDQQNNCLVVFERKEQESKEAQSSLYADALKTIESLDKLVTALFDKVAGKFDHLVEASLEEKKKKEKEKEDKEKEKEKKQ